MQRSLDNCVCKEKLLLLNSLGPMRNYFKPYMDLTFLLCLSLHPIGIVLCRGVWWVQTRDKAATVPLDHVSQVPIQEEAESL